MSEKSLDAARSRLGFASASTVVAIALAALATYPLVRVFVRLFYVDGQLNFAAIEKTLALPDLHIVVGHTAVVVIASGIISLVVGGLFAWLNERTDARMGPITDAMPLLPFLVPPVAGAAGWILLLSPRAGMVNAAIRDGLALVGLNLDSGPFDIFSWYGLIFVYVLYQVPYAYLMITAGLRGMDPLLEEQSRVSGAGLVRTLRLVTLPALTPAVGAAVLLLIWSGFVMLSVPIILARPVSIQILSVRIIELISLRFPPQMDVAVGLSVIIVLIVGSAWYAQSRLLRKGRFSTISGKHAAAKRIALGRWRGPVRAVMIAYVAIAVVLPALALAAVALQGFWTPRPRFELFGLDAIKNAWSADGRAVTNSVFLGVVGGFIGIVGAAIVAFRVVRSSDALSRTLDGLIKFPAAIANIVIAVGILIAFAGPPFNLVGTLTILLIGYIVLYLPQGSVAADAAAGQVGDELVEASHVAGARGLRTFRKISVPLMLPGLLAGWALLFVRMAGDLTASAILAGTSNPVIGRRILEISESGTYASLASLAAMLVVVTSTVLFVAFGYVRRRTRWTGASVDATGVGM